MRRGRLGAVVGVLVAFGVASPADARGRGDNQEWHLHAELVTDAPLQLGARAVVIAPHRLRLSMSLGVMPSAYVNLINDLARAFDWYDPFTAAIIESALGNSLIMRWHAGWQPWEERGFYFELGYTLATLGGGTTTEQILADATGLEPDDRSRSHSRAYQIDSTLHLIDVELGWEWVFDDTWTLRTALGYAGTVASSTTVEAQFPARFTAAVHAIESGTAAYLDDVYTSYVHTAVLTLGIGFRVF